MGEADLVLWLRSSDVAEPANEPSGGRVMFVTTKADLSPVRSDGLLVSAQTGEGLELLLDRVAQELDLHSDGSEPPLVAHERQIFLLQRTVEELEAITAGDPAEILAEHLRRASRPLGQLAGTVDVENVLDEIFSHFCIGK